jgi:hypothetical protein
MSCAAEAAGGGLLDSGFQNQFLQVDRSGVSSAGGDPGRHFGGQAAFDAAASWRGRETQVKNQHPATTSGGRALVL